eukprot:COSAG06_NODE_58299_length_277_cov_0.876404_1_plen_79_part_10
MSPLTLCGGARVDRQPPGRPVTAVLWFVTVPLVRPRGGSGRAPPRAGDASEPDMVFAIMVYKMFSFGFTHGQSPPRPPP